jgi:CMP-N-acetylneuraminic acid synthetase
MCLIQTLCVIPARGGSKGIPRKNVVAVAGKPLIAWAIETAFETPDISRVVVSTDDQEIAEVALRYGADVVWRPAEISGDTSSSESALLHVLEHLCQNEGYRPDLLVFMQCTSPLTSRQDIGGALALYRASGADVVFSVVRTHAFLWRMGKDGFAEEVNHNRNCRPRRQDMEAQYRETGAFYLIAADAFRKNKKRFFGRVMFYEVPPERAMDIDEPADLKMAERLLLDK